MSDFGEILEPSSRAFWDDFEYDQTENCETYDMQLSLIEWEWYTEDKKEPKNLKVSAFYVIEGGGMQNFLETTIIKNQKPMGGLRNKNIMIYYFKDKNYIIVTSSENNLNVTAAIPKHFENLLDMSTKLYTFSLQSKIQYKSAETKELTADLVFLRGINSEVDYIKEIKSPNFITGIAAGAATIRFLNKLHYSCYIAYTDPLNELDAFIAKPILNFFKEIKIDCDIKYVSKSKDSSLLYM